MAITAFCLHLDSSANAVLCLAPALALGALLCARRYPGERLLATIRRHTIRRGPRPARSIGEPIEQQAWIARGGLLIARALAVRPPPPALRTS